jgi:rSAM/selenodomain-associated transferase 1
MKSGLIIFLKNLEYGKVKTRLAATLGHETAMEIYRLLLEHTRAVTENIKIDKFLFYSDQIEEDEWPTDFSKYVQEGGDLGERMLNAFRLLFSKGYEKLVIIGTDCLELNSGIIESSLTELEKTDAVIGPAKDGGYYLLGLTKECPFLFRNITWSSESVLQQTVTILDQKKLSYSFLETLNDIDEAEDWLNTKRIV